MSFAQRLETLLDIYRVSNAALARGLGVDASLVSRWKTGDRLPPPAHNAPHEIAVFLSGLPLRPPDSVFLKEALGPWAHAVGPADAMENYLLEIPYAPAGGTSQAEQETLLGGLCALLQRDGASALRGPVSLWPRVQKGQPLEHEAFFGPDGRRQAAINFLHAALSGSRQTGMYLLLPEHPAWISGTFAALFYHSLYAFTQRGGAIHIIHKRPADTHGLFSTLSALLPHYVTGRVFSYTLAEDRHCPPAPALFVAQGLCATVTYRDPPSGMTALYRAASDVALFEKLFQEYLSDAQPLSRACDHADPMALPAALLDLERRPGDCHVVSRALNPLWAPDSLLQEHQALEAISLMARRRDALASLSARWVEIWPEELLRGIERRGRATLALELFSGRPGAVLSGEALALYLSALLHALRIHERVQLLAAPSLINVGYLLCKRHAGALLVPEPQGPPAALQLFGEDGLSLIDGWFASRAAAAQNKRQVMARLQAALDGMGHVETA